MRSALVETCRASLAGMLRRGTHVSGEQQMRRRGPVVPVQLRDRRARRRRLQPHPDITTQ